MEELAKNLGMTARKVTELLQASGDTVSLETPVGDETAQAWGILWRTTAMNPQRRRRRAFF